MSAPQVPLSTRLDAQINARMRAAVVALQRQRGPEYTLAQFVGEAVLARVQDVEDELNAGRQFTADATAPLARGRRAAGPRENT